MIPTVATTPNGSYTPAVTSGLPDSPHDDIPGTPVDDIPSPPTPPVPSVTPTKKRRILTHPVPALICAAVFAAAVTVEIHAWVSLGVEAGGSCGGHYGACPRGQTTATLVPIVLILVTIGPAFVSLFRRGWVLRILTVIAMVAGLFGGQQAYAWVHGVTLSPVWQAPFDASSQLKTEGVWVDGGSLIRVRADQVVAYAQGSGQQQWTEAIPGRDVVCAMSRTTSQHVGLLGYAPEQSSCDTFVAVDLGTGRTLWTKHITIAGLPTGTAVDILATSGDTASLITANGLVGYDLRTGAQRWQAPLAADCDMDSVTGGPVLAMITNCDDRHDYQVMEINPTSGQPTWTTPVSDADPDADDLDFVNDDPVTVELNQAGARGATIVYGFDATGHRTATIPLTTVPTPDGPAEIDTNAHAADAIPASWEFVTGGVLVAVTEPVGSDQHQYLLGYRLATGQLLWTSQLPDAEAVAAVAGDGSRVLLLAQDQPTPVLYSLSLDSGHQSVVGLVDSDLLGDDPGLVPAGSDIALVNDVGQAPTPPVVVLPG